MKTTSKKPTKNTSLSNIIGVRELSRDMKRISLAVKRGESFLVMRNTEPIFRIEPIVEKKNNGKYTLKDLMSIRFKSGEKNLSKRVDEIVYGI